MPWCFKSSVSIQNKDGKRNGLLHELIKILVESGLTIFSAWIIRRMDKDKI